MGIRRVVTGHDEHGKSVFASDEVVEPITVQLLPGAEFYPLWGSDQPARFPDDGSRPQWTNYFPSLGGFRFGLFCVGTQQSVDSGDIDMPAVLQEIEDKLPGLAGHMEPNAPGMHTTATIDYEYVASGRVILELDDGATRELKAGDTVVQNGTRHAWRNPYDEPCLIAVVLVGAHHDNA